MLDSWIIEELKRREKEEADADRPSLELPLDCPPFLPEEDEQDEEENRGVVVIDMV